MYYKECACVKKADNCDIWTELDLDSTRIVSCVQVRVCKLVNAQLQQESGGMDSWWTALEAWK